MLSLFQGQLIIVGGTFAERGVRLMIWPSEFLQELIANVVYGKHQAAIL
jgi:hypothetical protein